MKEVITAILAVVTFLVVMVMTAFIAVLPFLVVAGLVWVALSLFGFNVSYWAVLLVIWASFALVALIKRA